MDRQRLLAFAQDDYPRVVAVVTAACGDHGQAEDAVQDVLAATFDRATDTEVQNLAGFVVTAALNRVRSAERRRGAERRALQRLTRRAARPPGTTARVGDEVLDALRSLPARQREIVALHYLFDMSVADVARSLDVSNGTVKTQLHRARATLREHFDLNDTTGDAAGEEVDRVRR